MYHYIAVRVFGRLIKGNEIYSVYIGYSGYPEFIVDTPTTSWSQFSEKKNSLAHFSSYPWLIISKLFSTEKFSFPYKQQTKTDLFPRFTSTTKRMLGICTMCSPIASWSFPRKRVHWHISVHTRDSSFQTYLRWLNFLFQSLPSKETLKFATSVRIRLYFINALSSHERRLRNQIFP